MTDEMASPPWPDQLGRGETAKRLAAMKVAELQSIADYEGIKTGPKKEDTVNRIMGVWFDKARPDFPPPAPMTPPPPPTQSSGLPLGRVIYPPFASKPPYVGPFDRRAIKKQLKLMTLAEIQDIADQEGIKPDSKGAVLDKWDMIPRILDIWQWQAGAIETLAEAAPGPAREQQVSKIVTPVVSPPPVARVVQQSDADPVPWPLELGRPETTKRLKAMKAVEIRAIAENEGIEVGPKKEDTVNRILKAWFVDHTATRFQPKVGREPDSGMSARVQRIRDSRAR
jgi:hypothetical protein